MFSCEHGVIHLDMKNGYRNRYNRQRLLPRLYPQQGGTFFGIFFLDVEANGT